MPKFKKNPSINWKLPTIIFTATLLFIMFLIPSIIVVPFKEDNKATQASIETAVTKETKKAVESLESPFQVNVFRTEVNEVEEIPLEEYVINVVASEMPAEFELEP